MLTPNSSPLNFLSNNLYTSYIPNNPDYIGQTRNWGAPLQDEDDEEDTIFSVEFMLDGFGPVAAEFEDSHSLSQLENSLAQQLNTGDLPVRLGPLIIPSWRKPSILFVSVRTLAEAAQFGVHLFANATDEGDDD